ncbi:MAG: 5'/3'-nucleotidase SurE [Planctomycetota bacterium]
MRFLITNDDGWGEDGIRALEQAASQFGEVWVVAPDGPRSGISHQITFDRSIVVKQKSDRSFAISGTPADCVRWSSGLGVKFDWVLSGVNNGANLGADIFVSGTVAAAREAILHGIPSIAFSQHRRAFNAPGFDWTRTTELVVQMIPELTHDSGNGNFRSAYNVNFPDRPDVDIKELAIHHCPIDFSSLPAEFEARDNDQYHPVGLYNERARVTGGDIELCFNGSITVTGFNLDLGDMP